MGQLVLAPLYVPGDRPDRFARALSASPDVIIDLEDAVAPDRKDQARDAAVAALGTRGVPDHPRPFSAFVRINAVGSPWGADDLEAVAGLPGLRGIRVPKVEGPKDVAAVAGALAAAGSGLGVGVTCVIESAVGVEEAYRIASADPRVTGLALGEADLASNLGVSAVEGLAFIRSRVIVAASAAGLAPPNMSVYPHVTDLDGLAVSCRAGRALGFLGRACIHPRQVPVVVEAFTPSAADVDRASATLDALAEGSRLGHGVVVCPDGRMLDPAMAGVARRTLEVAAAARRYLRHRR
jgi:citrate lyase subunit beta / citryl-CoA lyase